MKAIIISLVMLVFFISCASHNVQLYEKIDNSNKTVTVPPGSSGLTGKLKKALSEDGWKLAVYRGPSVVEGELGEKTKLQQYDTFNTRYRLIVSFSQFDLCFNFSPAIRYDISFIDNQSGTEAFTMDGRDCESDVVEKFKDILRGIDD